MALASLAPYPTNTELLHLAEQAALRKPAELPYSGDVSAQAAYAYVRHHPGLIVDVRTAQEWQADGVPDLADTQAALSLISWKTYPDYSLNPEFKDRLTAQTGGNTEMPLFFLCRSGGRSLDAALSMAGLGYRYCFNIEAGFIGGHGQGQSWKSADLPWKRG